MTTCCRYFLLLFYSLIEALETLSTVGLSVADSSSWTDALDTLSAVSGASFLEAPLTASTFFPPTNSCPVCFKYQSTIGLKSKIYSLIPA